MMNRKTGLLQTKYELVFSRNLPTMIANGYEWAQYSGRPMLAEMICYPGVSGSS